MSWQDYVDISMVKTGNVDKAAIFSLSPGDSGEHGDPWASSSGFRPKEEEVKHLVSAFSRAPKEDEDIDRDDVIWSEGFHVAGDKYFTIKAEGKSIYGKKGKEGVVVRKTKQAVLIAHYPEDVQPGVCAKTVEELGDYLVGASY